MYGKGKKLIIKRKAFLSLLTALLTGIFLLSGCGQSDSPITQTEDNHVNEENGTDSAEAEGNNMEEGHSIEDNKNNEPPEDLPKPPDVPVNTTAEDIPYYSEDGIQLHNAAYGCVSDGENIYLAYGRQDLYVMPIGADRHSPANIDNPEGLYVCKAAMDTYGRLHLLTAGPNYDEWYIWRLDEDYQIDKVIDISAYFETEWEPVFFLIDKDGAYYLQWPLNSDGIILDSEGVLKHRFTLKSLEAKVFYYAAVGKDGRIYLVHGEQGEKLEIDELDMESCSLKKKDSSLYFPYGENFTAMSAGTDTNLLLFSPYSGVWAYDNEKGILENRVPLSDIGSGSGMDFHPLTFLPDGRLLLLDGTVNDSPTGNADALLKYIPVGR